MVVYGIPFRKGDRVVTTMSEYGSNVIAMLQIAKRGVDLIVVPDDERGQIDHERLDAQLDSRVRAVLVSHMPTNGGLIQPAEEIGRIVRDRAPDAWYVLDAIQAVGQISLDMAAIGCDALAGTSRKYLRGPRGAGFVVVRQDRLDELEPPMIDNQAATWTGPRSYQLRPDARRFESWEANHAARLGMGVAVAYAREIGIERIAARIVRQAERLRSELSGLAGVTVRDQGRQQGGIVTFTHERLTPLGDQGVPGQSRHQRVDHHGPEHPVRHGSTRSRCDGAGIGTRDHDRRRDRGAGRWNPRPDGQLNSISVLMP